MPLTGYRFTCTLNTFMKIERRIARSFMNVGSSTSVIITTLPSAGAMTSRSPRSPLRSGSRKKYATQSAMSVSANASSQSGHERRDERDAERAGGDERRDDDEAQSFAGEVHEVDSVEASSVAPGDAAERVEVAGARRIDDVPAAAAAAARRRSSGRRAARRRDSRAAAACRSSAATVPGAYRSAGQKRELSGVSTSSISVIVPSRSRPNSNFVSAMMIPRSAAISRPRS